MRLKNDTRTVS